MKNSKIKLFSSETSSRLNLLDKKRTLESFIGEKYSPYQNLSLENFINNNRTKIKSYNIEPINNDLTAGKNTYVYDAHTYHTKVPPEAIESLINHYTDPDDLILDPFCGSGMTGLAALNSGRKAVLIDLSPSATFISFNFLTTIDEQKYLRAINEILRELRNEELFLYGTHCRECGKLVPIEYMVWSYGLVCEYCQKEFVLWDVAREEHEDIKKSKIKSEFSCPNCNKLLNKRKLLRTKVYPVQVGYRCCNSNRKDSQAPPNRHDLDLILNLEKVGIPEDLWYPNDMFPDGVNTRQIINHKLKSVDSLYTLRNLQIIARLWDIASRWPDEEVGLKIMFTVTSLYQRVTRLSEFRFWGGSGNIANYNVPMIFNEQNVLRVFERKAKTIFNHLNTCKNNGNNSFCISTQSATELNQVPENSIDYIFTDPPFGGNINYSEMNFLWEAWFGIFTDKTDEAIINRVQGKDASSYSKLLTQAFCEMHRVLKPNRWLSVMFHNSSSKVWSAILNALSNSGFKVDKIQILDKKHGTFKQFVSENTVGYDMIMHCRKNDQLEREIQKDINCSQISIAEWLKTELENSSESFTVKFLHVDRDEEIDYRKLYSLWLKQRIESDSFIEIDFDKFRSIVDQLL